VIRSLNAIAALTFYSVKSSARESNLHCLTAEFSGKAVARGCQDNTTVFDSRVLLKYLHQAFFRFASAFEVDDHANPDFAGTDHLNVDLCVG